LRPASAGWSWGGDGPGSTDARQQIRAPIATLQTYVHLVAASIRARAQYRLSFALDFVATFFSALSDFVAILVLFSHLPVLGGWSLPQVALLYGVAGVSFAVTDMLIGHLDGFGDLIRTGAFDTLLVRPHGSLFQVVASELAIRRLGKLAQSLAVLAYALANAHVAWSPFKVGLLLVTFATGTAIFTGIWVAGASISFWTTDIREVVNAFTYGGSYLASYPINLFGVWLRRFLAFVVPAAFIAYYPCVVILGKSDPVAGLPWLGLLSPIVALATLAGARVAWQFGVRRYRSTGS
jgi:ABC-2 type transport system permease protein